MLIILINKNKNSKQEKKGKFDSILFSKEKIDAHQHLNENDDGHEKLLFIRNSKNQQQQQQQQNDYNLKFKLGIRKKTGKNRMRNKMEKHFLLKLD